ncbi:MAG: 50S ribosomal protein L29 [Bacilli bacterium]|nr:50S ribosomal protein L29 [Bacilli bacterium]MCI7622123.1 50S ribosomal protein L29 [Bacilli bacterium]MDD6227387.1 50S ribosomal protein L29 [Bacilli bacterium]MDD7375209.1 50S ribosomal protein L29 [Bacilli bacterium]MDD7549155.1 50S ribosomal protein L29 [Bacilli bacterium]
MRIEEVRKLTDQELVEKVYELKSDLMALRFQQKTGNLDNGKKITEVRKTIAKVLTVQKERQLANKESK